MESKRAFESYPKGMPRLVFFYALVGGSLLILWLGLFWRQVVCGKVFDDQGKAQSLRRIVLVPSRGKIFDRKGRLLAGDRPRYSAVIYLNELRPEFRALYAKSVENYRRLKKPFSKDELQWSVRRDVVQRHVDVMNRLLKKRIQVDSKRIELHFSQRLLLPMKVLEDLSEDDYAKLMTRLPAGSPIQIAIDSVRYYPYGSAACHALGYVVNDSADAGDGGEEDLMTFSGQERVGKTGLEASFDSWLRGTSGGEIWLVDPSGMQYERLLAIKAQAGRDLYTSLDIDSQIACERAFGDECGAIVMLKVATGEVLAMVSKPDFDLNDLTPKISNKVYDDISEKGAWINRALQGLYPPASPFKLVATTAMLRKGVVDESSFVECTGGYEVGDRTFHCHRLSGHGFVKLKEAIQLSCNPFYYKYALRCGPRDICAEAKAFGFDKPTGIELPFEAHRMLVPDPDWKMLKGLGRWTDGDTANLVIGQGFTRITPLQMACFVASIAHQKMRIKPTILRCDGPQTGDQEPLGLSAEKYQAIVNGMIGSVDEGTGQRAQVAGLNLAGKTGTGQIQLDRPGKFKNIAWFVGFAPAQAPEIALVILIERSPEGYGITGGMTASPIAQAILRDWVQ